MFDKLAKHDSTLNHLFDMPIEIKDGIWVYSSLVITRNKRMKIRMYVFAICLQFYGCLYVLGLTMRIRVV